MTFTVLKTMPTNLVSVLTPSPLERVGVRTVLTPPLRGGWEGLVLSSPLRGDRRGACSKVADVANKNYELNLDVKSGIYFVEVIDTATNTYYKQKLVIQK